MVRGRLHFVHGEFGNEILGGCSSCFGDSKNLSLAEIRVFCVKVMFDGVKEGNLS